MGSFCAYGYILAPTTKEGTRGGMARFEGAGPCIFINDEGLCEIYAVRPYECRKQWHGMLEFEGDVVLDIALQAWKQPKAAAQLRELLGGEPVMPVPTEEEVRRMVERMGSNIPLRP